MTIENASARLSSEETEQTAVGAAPGVLSRLSIGQVRIAAILAGGALGTLARAGLAEALRTARAWPWATFIVNLAGAFILGWLLTRLAERTAPTRTGAFRRDRVLRRADHVLDVPGGDLRVRRATVISACDRLSRASIAAGMALAVAGVLVARWGRHW